MAVIFSDIEDALERYRDSVSVVDMHLAQCENEVMKIFENIATTSFENVDNLFDELFLIQRIVSTIKFKYDYPLTERWLDFAYQLDRDDIYSRKYWYDRIKCGLRWPID